MPNATMGAGHATELPCWAEWRDRCALALCAEPTRSSLSEFARIQFRAAVRRCRHRTNLGDSLPLPARSEDMWHLLETHMTVAHTRAGKRYKDWLFARGDGRDDLGAIEGGAAVIMRSVVRDHLRREFSPRNTMSLHQPIAFHGGHGLTLQDLLSGSADPAQEAAWREIRILGQRQAAEWLPELKHIERVALLAMELDLPLCDPVVLKVARVNSLALGRAHKGIMERVMARLQRAYAGEDRDSRLGLFLETAAALRAAAREWARTDRRARVLLNGSKAASSRRTPQRPTCETAVLECGGLTPLSDHVSSPSAPQPEPI